jgi:hypothetical protein
MASSSLPPEEQPKVKTFNPLVLDRTVIAVPLLNEMKEDLDLIAGVKKLQPAAAQKFNSAIEFNRKFRGRAAGARKWAIEKLAEVAKDALNASASRLKNVPTDAARELENKRRAELQKAVEQQVIAPLEPKSSYSFALLHASVIRRLLMANEREAPAEKHERRPIVRVYPRRFEVIIDLNLEYPGGREAARQWVIDHIEPAKEAAEVRDAGQEIHFEKDQVNSQYIFARLEARAIQKLVELDMATAKADAERRNAENEEEERRLAETQPPLT